MRGGRLTLDELTELPEGTLVEFVPSDTVVWLVQLDGAEADADQPFDLREVLAGLRSSYTPSLKARVQNQRLVLDEPTELPDGKSGLKPSDPFLHAVGSVRDFVVYMVKTANWALTLACAGLCVSRLVWPLLPDDSATRALFGLFALSLGACIGKPLDHRLAAARAKREGSHSSRTRTGAG